MEILNLDYHKGHLVVKALNKFKVKREVAKALGVSTRMVLYYRDMFDIKQEFNGKYWTWTSHSKILKPETYSQ